MREIEKGKADQLKTLQAHCCKKLNKLKNKMIANRTNNERISQLQYDANIASIFDDFQSEICFNTKRATRAATKYKKTKCIFSNGTDLSRIRFHLREDEVKKELGSLLAAEQDFDEQNGVCSENVSMDDEI